MIRLKFVLDGEEYQWNGRSWSDKYNIVPSNIAVRELNSLLSNHLIDNFIIGNTNIDQLISHADTARESENADLSVKLLNQIAVRPIFDSRILLKLVASLRLVNQVPSALKLLGSYKYKKSNVAVITIAAACYLDLQDTRSAETCIQKASKLQRESGKPPSEYLKNTTRRLNKMLGRELDDEY